MYTLYSKLVYLSKSVEVIIKKDTSLTWNLSICCKFQIRYVFDYN